MGFNVSWHLCALVIVISLTSGCSEPEQPLQVEVIRPAKLITVTAKVNVKEYRFPAVIEALNSKNLVFQVSGQIISLNVREGQAIEKGQVIAQLDKRVFNNQLDAAQTQLNTAKIEFERAQRLIAADAIAKSIFDQRENTYNVAITSLDSAKKALEDTRLIAPFSGIIANAYVEELDAISPATAIVTIQTEGPVEAKVKVPANLVSQIKQFEAIETTVILDSQGSQPLPAKRVGVIALADERSQTFEVNFSFTPLANMTVLPGMTGVVISKITFNKQASPNGQIFIPIGAVVSDAKGQFVWLVDTNTYRVSRRNIAVGDIQEQNIMISTGLKLGDTIIGAGGAYLQEGMKIRPLEN